MTPTVEDRLRMVAVFALACYAGVRDAEQPR